MSRKRPSKSDIKRFHRLQDIGDIIAYKQGKYEPADIHHITSGGRRFGHDYTIPLNPWRHRGTILPGFTKEQMLEAYGPSLAESKEDFEAAYGTELDLLDEVNEILNAGTSQ